MVIALSVLIILGWIYGFGYVKLLFGLWKGHPVKYRVSAWASNFSQVVRVTLYTRAHTFTHPVQSIHENPFSHHYSVFAQFYSIHKTAPEYQLSRHIKLKYRFEYKYKHYTFPPPKKSIRSNLIQTNVNPKYILIEVTVKFKNMFDQYFDLELLELYASAKIGRHLELLCS